MGGEQEEEEEEEDDMGGLAGKSGLDPPRKIESMGVTYLFKDKGNGKGQSCQGVPGIS